MSNNLQITKVRYDKVMKNKGEFIKVRFYIENENRRYDAKDVKINFNTGVKVYNSRRREIEHYDYAIGNIDSRDKECITIYLKSEEAVLTPFSIEAESENLGNCFRECSKLCWTDTSPALEYLENLADCLIDNTIDFDLEFKGEIFEEKKGNFVARIGAADIDVDDFDDLDMSASISGSVVELKLENLNSACIEGVTLDSLTGSASAQASFNKSGFYVSGGAKVSIASIEVESHKLEVGRFGLVATGSIDVGTLGAKLKSKLKKEHKIGGSSFTINIGAGAALGFDLCLTFTW